VRFDDELAAIASDLEAKVTQLDEGYARALRALLKKIRDAGDLDGTTAVMAEVARLKKEGGVPEVKSGIGEVADLQEVYTKELGKLKTAKDEQIVALAKQYDTALDKMERQLVSANELESALKVREERRRVGDNPEVLAARKRLKSGGQEDRTPSPTLLGPSESSMCEVEIAPSRSLAIASLKKGAARLSGGFRPTFSHVDEELVGAQFTVSPWQSKHEIEVRPKSPGYLIVIGGFGNREDFGGQQERVGRMLKSEHCDAPTKLLVKPGDKFVIKGHEIGVVARKIVVR
jgi:hypothetical protein